MRDFFIRRLTELAERDPRIMLITGDLADQHWRPDDAQAAAATMPRARAVAVTGAGHLGPLLLDVDLIAKTIGEFCKSPP